MLILGLRMVDRLPFAGDVPNEEASRDEQVEAIVDELQIPRRALGTVLINGLHAKTTDEPKDGDVVALLPILGGG